MLVKELMERLAKCDPACEVVAVSDAIGSIMIVDVLEEKDVHYDLNAAGTVSLMLH